MHRTNSDRAVAMVIVLGFIVLVTGLLVAFFSRSILDRQISNSSASQTKVELFAEGAINATVVDLRQEIIMGSSNAGTAAYPVYVPTTAANAVPSLVGSSGTSGLENLLKISGTQAFFVTGTARGCGALTTGTSLNGRYMPTAQWNKPLLMPPVSESDFTPHLTSGTFTPPGWILVARNGSNPTVWNSNLVTSATNSTSVIGRYAYAIYNEGGLLDANAAGYPSTSSTNQSSYKSAAAFADLTQIGLTQLQIDQLVGWRNYASTQAPGASYASPGFTSASGSNYYRYVVSNTAGFMTTGTFTNNHQTDRMFVNRQQLLSFLTNGLAVSATSQAYQCLGTFSRSLNQPSYVPNPNRPKVIGAAYPGTGSTYSGGNSAYTYDDLVNPAFPGVRVSSAFPRNDGSAAMAGEPLIKKRFALNRLCWLTCEGPSASASTAVQQAYIDQGISSDLLDQGTPSNILKYFGLTWTAGPGSNGRGGYWTYNHGISNTIGTLSAVAAVSREADFFELLKAGIHAGSLANAAGATNVTIPRIGAAYQFVENSRLDDNIIQIGANIIDQFAPDSYPTNIVFNDGVLRYFSGVDDLPYLYATNTITVLARDSNPAMTSNTAAPPVTPPATITDAGLVVGMEVPIIWNPHTAGTAAIASGLSPGNLRVCISGFSVTAPSTIAGTPSSFSSSCTPQYSGSTIQVSGVSQNVGALFTQNQSTTTAPWLIGSYNSSKGCLDIPAAGVNTALYFNNNAALYREPTPLFQPGIPRGSDLGIDSSNVLVTSGNFTTSGVPEVASSNKYLGFYLCQFPKIWNASGVFGTFSGTCTLTTGSVGYSNSPLGHTISLEYKAGSSWIPYQQVISMEDTAALVAFYNGVINSWGKDPISARVRWDPRSTRWSMCSEEKIGDFTSSSGNTTINTIRSGAGVDVYNISHGIYWLGGAASDLYCVDPATSRFSIPVVTPIYDADGVRRRAMGAYVPGTLGGASTTTVGLPLASVVDTPANQYNRPVILHRPFRTVAELGYVFSDMPWKNLNFCTPESGFAALLDIFCVNEDRTPDGVVAGKVDLNTRQTSVLQALFSGANREGVTTTDTPLASGTGAEAGNVARALLACTGTCPLSNIGDIVGRWNDGVAATGSNYGPDSYDGFSVKLDSSVYSSGSTAYYLVQRMRESAIRALSDTGQAGTWNVMIDLVAQTGRYPASAASSSRNSLDKFVVEGEKRYWIHVAINRRTGQVIDRQIELVSE